MPTPKKPAKKKASVGGGSLRTANKFNLKRALPIIAVMTLVGGFFVFRSFAGSANASFVTEMYQRCYNEMKTSGSGYDYWVSELDTKKRDTNGAWSAFVAASGKPCSYPYPPVSASAATPAATASGTKTAAKAVATSSKSSVSEAWVKQIYSELLGRTPSAKDIAYWADKGRTLSPDQIKNQIANTDEAFKKNIDDQVRDAHAWKLLSSVYVQNGINERNTADDISKKNPVTYTQLRSIASIEGTIKGWEAQVQQELPRIQGLAMRAGNLKLAQASTIRVAADSMNANANSLKSLVANVSGAYVRAERTYEANLGFFEKLKWQAAQEARLATVKKTTAINAFSGSSSSSPCKGKAFSCLGAKGVAGSKLASAAVGVAAANGSKKIIYTKPISGGCWVGQLEQLTVTDAWTGARIAPAQTCSGLGTISRYRYDGTFLKPAVCPSGYTYDLQTHGFFDIQANVPESKMTIAAVCFKTG